MLKTSYTLLENAITMLHFAREYKLRSAKFMYLGSG